MSYIHLSIEKIGETLGISLDKIISISWKITEILQSRLDKVNEILQALQEYLMLLKQGVTIGSAIIESTKNLQENSFSQIENLAIFTKNDFIEYFPDSDIEIYLPLFSQSRVTEDYFIKEYPNEVNFKPLIKIKEEAYFLITGNYLFIAIGEKLKTVLGDNNKLADRFYKHKGNFLERKVLKHFKNIFGEKAKFYNSVYETSNSQNEHDILIIYKKTLIIIECKTTRIPKNFRDVEKGYKRISSKFNESIQAAFDQARRLKKLILSQGKNDLYDKDGNLLLQISLKEIDNIECVCITKESEGHLATNLNYLLKKEVNEDYPYCLNLADLTQLSEFKNYLGITPRKFVTYIKFRKALHGKVFSDDELDYWGYYLKEKSFKSLLKEREGLIQLDPSYSNIFDEAYLQKIRSKSS